MRLMAVSIAFLLSLAASGAAAHALRSAHLELRELDAERALALLTSTVPLKDVTVSLETGCSTKSLGKAAKLKLAYSMHCDAPIAGTRLVVDNLPGQLASVTLTYLPLSSMPRTRLVTFEESATSTITMPLSDESASPDHPVDYLALGVEHILLGWDHLLFLLGVLALVEAWRRLLVPLLLFTVAHSVCLTVTALDMFRVSSQAAELCIALSLFFTARLIMQTRGRRAVSDASLRATCLLFGLVHGFGLAGALIGLGMPKDSVVSALLLFNLGIEAGQMLFILIASWCLVRFCRLFSDSPVRTSIAYLLGVTGSYLSMARLLA